MTRAYSAKLGLAMRLVAAALVLCALALAAGRAAAVSVTSTSASSVAVSLVQSAAAVPVGGTLGFTGVIRLPAEASSVQARIQIRHSGRVVFQRTSYLDHPAEGTQTLSFERPLEGLGLDPGTYPVSFSVHLSLAGSSVDTEVVQNVRVYSPGKPLVPVVLIAKVHARPLSGPHGGFSVDPATPAATVVRDRVDALASLVASDPLARLTIAVPPVTLEEWRLIASNGYNLASGTVVPASSPVALSYAGTLTHLQQALATGRLELATLGYSDPNLGDLSANKLAADAGAQYDTALSTLFASLETTPSSITAPAGGCAPTGMQKFLLTRHITSAIVDADNAHFGKKGSVATGVYPSATSTMTALVIDARASRGLESGDSSATIARTFERYGQSTTSQPVVTRIDLDETSGDVTSTVGAALAAVEGTPWARLVLGTEALAPKGARAVTLTWTATKGAPDTFWPKVRSARARAIGMLDILSNADDQATSAQTDSLLAESSAWAEPLGRWQAAGAGMSYADAAIKTANAAFSVIKVSASSVTLAGETGQVPVTIQNSSKKTLNVVVVPKTTGGMLVSGAKAIATKVAPGDTFIQIPIDMQSTLYGKLTVEVLAGPVVMTRQSVTVRRSYLDRLAFIGGIVVVLGGMLVWIVLRVRQSPDVADEDDEFEDEEPAETTVDEYAAAGVTQQLNRVVNDASDGVESQRYTEAHSGTSDDSDLR